MMWDKERAEQAGSAVPVLVLVGPLLGLAYALLLPFAGVIAFILVGIYQLKNLATAYTSIIHTWLNVKER